MGVAVSDWADREAQDILDRIRGAEATAQALLYLSQKIRVIRALGEVDGVNNSMKRLTIKETDHGAI